MCWAVPVFFMITGYLLLNPEREISYKTCVTKYVRRILIALFLFGMPFSILKQIMEAKEFRISQIFSSVTEVIMGGSFSHLWYLYTLIGIYLILPALKLIVKYTTEQQMRWLLIILLLMDFIVPLIEGLTGIEIKFDVPFKYPVFYVLFGYYLGFFKPVIFCSIKRNIAGVLLTGSMITVANLLRFSPKIWTSYNSPIIVLMAACMFCVFVTCEGIGRKNITDAEWKIDRLCFGVYIIHPLFIHFVYRFVKITPVTYDIYYFSAFIFFIIFLLCSFAASWIMYKIKPLRRYVL